MRAAAAKTKQMRQSGSLSAAKGAFDHNQTSLILHCSLVGSVLIALDQKFVQQFFTVPRAVER